jgi:2-hydroxychromene-2-carboxylate isomerase
MSRSVDFYFSIDSRYSYLAATQIAGIEQDCGVGVRWRPLTLESLLKARGASPFEGRPVSGQYERDYRSADVTLWAASYGIKLVDPDWDGVDWRRVNRAAVASAVLDVCPIFVKALYEAIMVRRESPKDDAAIARIAVAAGIDGARLVTAIDTPAVEERHLLHRDAALAAGVFGVPSFVADGTMFWGNDRIALLKWHLKKQR